MFFAYSICSHSKCFFIAEEKIQRLLHLVDSKYPAQLDEGLNEQLNAAKQQKGQGSREEVFSFVSLTFKGTRHQTVGDSDTTLYLSLQHPLPDVRLAAIKTIQELLEEESYDPEVRPSPVELLGNADFSLFSC